MSEPGPTGTAQFWDAQFSGDAYRYGTAPNAFVAAEAHRIAPGSEVVEFGVGEGHNAVFLAEQGHRVTALDIAPVALDKTRRLAGTRGGWPGRAASRSKPRGSTRGRGGPSGPGTPPSAPSSTSVPTDARPSTGRSRRPFGRAGC